MNLDTIEAKPKEPDERFVSNGNELNFSVVDFWTWNQSDLIENRNRGILAEFLVRQALGSKYSTRLEWDAYDLETEGGVKIEVKSAAYIQAWKQKRFSSISFDIRPTKVLLDDNNYSDDISRKADVYVFCLLHHKDQETINPMNLDQWTFYLVSSKTLNEHLPEQKTVGLSTLERILHIKCGYEELAQSFEILVSEKSAV